MNNFQAKKRKMVYLFILIILSVIPFKLKSNNGEYKSDCEKQKVLQKYLTSESVCLIKIVGTPKKCHTIYKYGYKSKIKVIKRYKGEIFDSVFIQGIDVLKGDKYLIYGKVKNNVLTATAFPCRKEWKLVKRKTSELKKNDEKRTIEETNYFRNQKRILKYELEIIKYLQHEYGESIVILPVSFQPIRYLQSKYFNHEFQNTRTVYENAKMTHVKLTISREKKIIKIDFLKKAPQQIRKEIEDYLTLYVKKCIKVIDEIEGKEMIEIVESFIYPKESIGRLDF